MLDYGIITTYSRKLLLKDLCWIKESSQHFHLRSPDMLKMN